jgi:P4 family phage/plasmid primase-like protien
MTLEKPKLEYTIDAVGSSLIQTYHLKTFRDTKETYFHSKQCIYEPHGEEIIEETVRQQVDRNISKHDLGEILYYIKTMTYVDRSDFDKDPNWLHVENGWVNVNNGEFVEHTPERLSLYKIPHVYDPAAANPEQREFFAEIFEEEDLDAVQKFFGYLLLPDQRYKKAFVGVGPKDTGKSKFAELVERFASMVSHVSLYDMAAFNHKVADITRSIVNTTSELPKYKLKDVSLFKGITGGDELSFREIYGKPFDARVRAKFLMVANELPDFEGMDQTFIDRWLVFRFSNVFKQGEDMDVNIMDKLTTPAEMSGLLNYALEGLAKLTKDGYFKNEDYADVKSKWESITSKIGDYKEKHCIMKPDALIPARGLYDDYCGVWRKDHDGKEDGMLSVRMFGREVKKLGVIHKQARIAGKQVWVYQGITTKERAVTDVTMNLVTPSTMENDIGGGVLEFTGTTVTGKEGTI